MARARLSGRGLAQRLRGSAGAAGDGLTGLLGRAALVEEASCLVTARGEGVAAVLVVDLDRLKEVNDALGHDAGDRLITASAERLVAEVGPRARVARIGGDEFAAVVPVAGEREAHELARRVEQVLSRPVRVRDLEVPCAASVGLAVSGVDGDDVDELLVAADQLMYAGRAGHAPPRPRVLRGRPVPEGGDLLTDLAQALREGSGELRVHYQPQVAPPGGRGAAVVGFQACARWEHPRLGPLPAAAFVHLAERAGLVGELDDLVLGTALADLPVLLARAPRARLTVSLSTHTLFSERLIDQLSGHLSRSGADGRRLRLAVAQAATGLASRADAALLRLGCGLSVQGFGTPRSSLTALWRDPLVREVRLHPQLVAGLLDGGDTLRLVRALVDAAHGLGLVAGAAQVESGAVAACLAELGCDALQGFWVAPPMALLDMSDWLDFWEDEPAPVTPRHQVVRSGLQD